MLQQQRQLQAADPQQQQVGTEDSVCCRSNASPHWHGSAIEVVYRTFLLSCKYTASVTHHGLAAVTVRCVLFAAQCLTRVHDTTPYADTACWTACPAFHCCPLCAAARGIASIRAGLAAGSSSSGSSDSGDSSTKAHGYVGRGALLLRGTLKIALTPADGSSSSSSSGLASTFLHMGGGWGRGEMWVNGHSLGR